MYDFWSNPRIKARSPLAAHQQSAVDRSESWDLVLAIQDTTELDYSHHRSKRGMGYLRGDATKGMLLHSVLSVTPIGTPMGILHQQLWARAERKTARSQRSNAQKESRRWIESLHATEAQLSDHTRILTIADREADLYDLLVIERYHYVLKSGCRVESLQLESFDRLERAIACYAILAWRLLWLSYVERSLEPNEPDLEADGVLEIAEWQALCHHYHSPPRSIDDPPGLGQCLRWLAQLGGFWGRKSDGDPGARTLWRGLRRLRDLVRQAVPPSAIAVASPV